MERLSETEFQSVGDLLRNASPAAPTLLNAYVTSDRQYKPLLKRDNARSIKLSKETREFSFTSPCYLRSVDFLSEDNTRLKNFLQVVIIRPDGTRQKIEPKLIETTKQDGSIVQLLRYSITQICTAVQFSVVANIRAVYATRFAAHGYTPAQLEGIAGKINEALSLVERADNFSANKAAEARKSTEETAKAVADLETAREELADLEVQEAQLKTEVAQLQLEINAAMTERTSLTNTLSQAQLQIEAVRNNETQLKQRVDSLNKELVEKQDDMARLANDRSLISDEFKDYVKEGKKQAWVYTPFLAACIGVIIYCSWQLYVGANRILVSDAKTHSEVYALILQRMPFAIAISLVVTAAWRLSNMFVTRIMAIHAQRLGLARLLVVAKDTVYSSMDGLDITAEQKFRERIRLKLMMLRSHLTSELGKDFDYVTDESDTPIRKNKSTQATDDEASESAEDIEQNRSKESRVTE